MNFFVRRPIPQLPMLPDPAPSSLSVLLVDDDEELVDMLKNYLEREGYSVDWAGDGEAGVREALSGRYAIAVVDIMMPRMNGAARSAASFDGSYRTGISSHRQVDRRAIGALAPAGGR